MLGALRGDETVYHLLVIGHLLTVVVGFGSTFVYPILGAQASKLRGKEGAAISDASLHAGHLVTTPVIIAAAVFGLILVAVGPYDWSDRYVQISIPIVIAAVLFSFLVHLPNLRKMNALAHEMANMGPPPAGAEMTGPPPQAIEMEKRGKAAGRNGGILTLAFLALLALMVFKPL